MANVSLFFSLLLMILKNHAAKSNIQGVCGSLDGAVTPSDDQDMIKLVIGIDNLGQRVVGVLSKYIWIKVVLRSISRSSEDSSYFWSSSLLVVIVVSANVVDKSIGTDNHRLPFWNFWSLVDHVAHLTFEVVYEGELMRLRLEEEDGGSDKPHVLASRSDVLVRVMNIGYARLKDTILVVLASRSDVFSTVCTNKGTTNEGSITKRFLHPDILATYDYIFIWDEDLGLEDFDAERYISLVRKHGLEISQPALSASSGLT
nr:uncharacterized protein [Tanacetum cinerariifolium]